MKLVPWIVKMAWRDSRSARKRLLVFTLSIMIGVTALVAIGSFGHNLRISVDSQARTLLGADLMLDGNQPLSPETRQLLDSITPLQSHEARFSSMAYFPKDGGTRLVQIRAIEGDFPYYGILETEPAGAAHSYQNGRQALVDDALMLQFHARVGDPIRIGSLTFRIAGRLKNIPGESPTSTFVSPRVYIPRRFLEETGLVQMGSRIDYHTYLKLPEGVVIEEALEQLEPHREEYRLDIDTVEERKEDLGRSLDNLYRFLSLVGFMALILAGIGIASAIHMYIKQRLGTIAILRCLGATSRQAFSIYLAQAATIGLAGALAGTLAGVALQGLLPVVLGDFLPVAVPTAVPWVSVAEGIGLGLGITLAFALLPLLLIRKISPLLTFRTDYEENVSIGPDPWRRFIYLLLAAAVFAFALERTRDWIEAAWFFAGLLAIFGLLAAVAKLIMLVVRKFFPASWPYVWRQGLANLYRPHNQTVLLVISLGLGTFMIVTLYLVHDSLLKEVSFVDAGSKPNLVLFDIQTDQREEVRAIVESLGVPVLQEVPIVTMRLTSINGETAQEIRRQTREENDGLEDGDQRRENDRRPSRWALMREYRSTYRDHLIDTEKLIAGRWESRVESIDDDVPVSIADRVADSLQVSIGDRLVFDVQGIPVTTRVASIREIDWRRFQPNFFVVFPAGALEAAPQFHVLVARIETTAKSAEVQREVVRRFPNISTIDLTLVINTIDGILNKVSFVVRFMTLFSILTGMIVLAGAIMTGRYQRMKEMVLLRTLGARRAQIIRIMVIEYAFLGSLAALTGLVLSFAASWALAYFIFEIDFTFSLLPVVVAFLALIGLTVLVGFLNSRGSYRLPLMEVLR
ncbi:MAG: ABC transporter permease [Acidobacteriota bacterium]